MLLFVYRFQPGKLYKFCIFFVNLVCLSTVGAKLSVIMIWRLRKFNYKFAIFNVMQVKSLDVQLNGDGAHFQESLYTPGGYLFSFANRD